MIECTMSHERHPTGWRTFFGHALHHKLHHTKLKNTSNINS